MANTVFGIEGKRAVLIPLKDGRNVKVFVHPEIVNLPENQGKQVLQEEFKRQYDMPFSEIIEGGLKTVINGLTLGAYDDLVDLLGIESIDEYNTAPEILEMKQPVVSAGLEALGTSIPFAVDALINPAKGTLTTAALRAMQAGKAQGPVKTALALARQRALETPTAGIALRETWNPLGLGQTGVTKQALESAAKGGLFGAAYGFGDSEGTLQERAQQATDVGNLSAAIGGAVPPLFTAGASVVNRLKGGVSDPHILPPGWKKGDPVPSDRTTMEQRIARSSILGALRRGGAEVTDAATQGRQLPEGVSMEDYLSPRYSDIWGQPVTVTPTAAVSRAMPDVSTQRSSMLGERLGAGAIDPGTGLPLETNELSSMLRWANQTGDSALASKINNILSERTAQESAAMGAAARRNIPQALPFSTEKLRQNLTARSKPVWETYYNNAYFASEGVPNTVPLVSSDRGLNLAKLLKGDAMRDAYKTAVANRSNDISTGDWNEVIRGINQKLPSYEQFISGRRTVPATTYREKRAVLEADGWTLYKEVKEPGPKKRVVKVILENKQNSVDVKTLHDMRGVLDDKINSLQNQNKGNEAQKLTQVRSALDDILARYSPSLKSADAEFAALKGVEEAIDMGKTALSGEIKFRDLQSRVGQLNPVQRRGYVTGIVESLENSNLTAAQILADANIRSKLATALPEGSMGTMLAELHGISSSSRMKQYLGDARSTVSHSDRLGLSEKLFSLLAKVPAYKFSVEFAAARDIVELSRVLSRRQNRIVAAETQKILQANTPEELEKQLRLLSNTYMKKFPQDASMLGHLSSLIGRITSVELERASRRGMEGRFHPLLGIE